MCQMKTEEKKVPANSKHETQNLRAYERPKKYNGRVCVCVCVCVRVCVCHKCVQMREKEQVNV